jgi:hypothetical protein
MLLKMGLAKIHVPEILAFSGDGYCIYFMVKL